MTTQGAPPFRLRHASDALTDVPRGIDLAGRNVIVTGGYRDRRRDHARPRRRGVRVTVPADDKAPGRTGVLWPTSACGARPHGSRCIDAFANDWLARHDGLHVPRLQRRDRLAAPLARDSRRATRASSPPTTSGISSSATPSLASAGSSAGRASRHALSLGHRITPMNFDDPNFERRDNDKLFATARRRRPTASCPRRG